MSSRALALVLVTLSVSAIAQSPAPLPSSPAAPQPPVAPTSQSVASAPQKFLADINGQRISLDEFNRRYEQNSQLVAGRKPDKKEVLKNIVYFELATQEAKRLGLHQDKDLKEQFDILLYQALVRRHIQPKIDAIKISEAEVRKYYEDNPLLRTSHIILLTRPGMPESELKELRARAENIAKMTKEGKKPFKDLAREYSEGPSARTGGDVDWGARHKLLPEYYEAALSLKAINDVSNVVVTPYGFHIIQLTGKKTYSQIDAVYKDFIIRTLRENKGKGIYDTYFEELKAKGRVKVDEALL